MNPDTVIDRLNERVDELQKQKEERADKGDDVGMAYAAGKQTGMVAAIAEIREGQKDGTDTDKEI